MICACSVTTALSAVWPAAVQAFQYCVDRGLVQRRVEGRDVGARSRRGSTWVLLDSRLTTIEMPMLLPRLRIRLNRPVASVRQSGGRVAKVTVLSGTKIRPKPRPCDEAGAHDRRSATTSGVKPLIS